MMVVEKKLKSIIVIIAWGLAALALSFILLQLFNPGKHHVDKAVYSADATSSIDYNVRLISNPINDTPKDAEPAKYYIMPFTDYISLNCAYSMSSDISADIAVSNYITAVLTSYIEEDNEEVILWEKEYGLAELETSQTADTSVSNERTFKLRFEEYTVLIDQLKDIYGYQSNYYIKVIYTTEYSAVYDEKTTQETLEPYIRINIDDMFYDIEGSGTQNSLISISNAELASDEINWERVIIGLIVLAMLVSLALLLPNKILRVGKLSESARQIKKINIKYGDRIVNVKDKPLLNENTVKVNEIEDIVKIADEIGQPIFSAKMDKTIYYYVTNINVLYYIAIENK